LPDHRGVKLELLRDYQYIVRKHIIDEQSPLPSRSDDVLFHGADEDLQKSIEPTRGKGVG
jgi:hypothetical protein